MQSTGYVFGFVLIGSPGISRRRPTAWHHVCCSRPKIAAYSLPAQFQTRVLLKTPWVDHRRLRLNASRYFPRVVAHRPRARFEHCVYPFRKMTAVGFEPTHPKIMELESTALNHSAKLS